MKKSTGLPVLFHFRLQYTLSALPCPARCVKKGCSAPPKSPNTARSELRIILRRWPNDAFTTFTNSASSQPSRPTLLRRRRITALLTLGGGLKTVSLTVKRYSMSYQACNNTLRMPYSFDPGGSAIRTATSFWIMPTHSGTRSRCSSTLKNICEEML